MWAAQHGLIENPKGWSMCDEHVQVIWNLVPVLPGC
jgi:hypothetical protein